jgi:autotransporter-associated beta strand protein
VRRHSSSSAEFFGSTGTLNNCTLTGNGAFDGGGAYESTLNNIAIPGDLFIGDGQGGLEADLVIAPPGPQQINDNARVTLESSGKLDLAEGLETIGSRAGSGVVVLTDLELRTGRNGVPTTFSGQIRGNGSLTKQGAREFTLTRESNNQDTGPTLVSEGTLIIDAIQPNSGVTVSSGATLKGSGQVGAIISRSAATGAPGASPGRLTASDAGLSSGSIFSVELGGPTAGLDHDQLNVAGTVDINGAQLAPSLVPGFAPSEGQVFTIIDNPGGDAVLGTFNGLANGAVLISP